MALVTTMSTLPAMCSLGAVEDGTGVLQHVASSRDTVTPGTKSTESMKYTFRKLAVRFKPSCSKRLDSLRFFIF